MQKQRVLKRESIWLGKFLKAVRTIYEDRDGTVRTWESVERMRRNIVSIVLYDEIEGQFILIEQYRLPVATEPAKSMLSELSSAIRSLKRKLPERLEQTIFGSALTGIDKAIIDFSMLGKDSISEKDGVVIELVAGVCDVDGEAQKDAAVREAMEEAGYKPTVVICMSANDPVSAGMQNELLTVYLGTRLVYVGKKKGWEEDGIRVHHVPREKIFDWLKDQKNEGKMVDAKVAGNIAYALRIIEQNKR